MNRMLKTACAAAMATVALGGLAAADYPERPVEFVVPWPPGDLEDVLTRMIAEDFQEAYGVPAAVVTRPGGGGGPFPGAISVATAPADGCITRCCRACARRSSKLTCWNCTSGPIPPRQWWRRQSLG